MVWAYTVSIISSLGFCPLGKVPLLQARSHHLYTLVTPEQHWGLAVLATGASKVPP